MARDPARRSDRQGAVQHQLPARRRAADAGGSRELRGDRATARARRSAASRAVRAARPASRSASRSLRDGERPLRADRGRQARRDPARRQQQRVPADWVVSVFDAKNARVARSRDHERDLGTPPTQCLHRPAATACRRGRRPQRDARGRRRSTPPSRGSGASAGPSRSACRPRSPRARWRQSALAYGGGILLSLGLGGLAAWLIARSIAGPIGRLRDGASALGRGESPAARRRRRPGRDRGGRRRAGRAAAQSRERSEADRDACSSPSATARESRRTGAGIACNCSPAPARCCRARSRRRRRSTAIASVIVPDIADCLPHRPARRATACCSANSPTTPIPARAASIAEHGEPRRVDAGHAGLLPHGPSRPARPTFANFESPSRSMLVDPVFRAFAKAIGMRATCVVPLVARGRTIGAMGAMQAESGRQFSAGGRRAARRAGAAGRARARQRAPLRGGPGRAARSRGSRTARRTSSSRCSATSCATRWRRSSRRSSVMARRDGSGRRARAPHHRAPGRAPVAPGRRPARRLAHRLRQDRLHLERARPARRRRAARSSSSSRRCSSARAAPR